MNSLVVPALAYKNMTPAEFEKKPIGTGPYKAIEYARDKPVKLEAWDGYRLGKPFPDKLTVTHVPEPSTRVAELLAGTAHIVQNVPIDALASIEANPKLEVVNVKVGSTLSHVFNIFRPPFNDKRVRQAMNYAIDRDAIVKSVLRGYGAPLPSILWPGIQGYTEDVKPYPYDPAKAKALLTEAGYPNGFSFNWIITKGMFQKDFEVSEAVANQLAKVGIKANLVVMEMARIIAERAAGNYELLELIWSPSVPQQIGLSSLYKNYPDDKLVPQFGPTPAELVQARKIFTEAGSYVDYQKQDGAFAELNRLGREQAFWLYINTVDSIWGIQKSTGWRPYPGTWAGDMAWYDYWTLLGQKAPTARSYDMLGR